jgi:quercetin dioxygenase-like cupin family protein
MQLHRFDAACGRLVTPHGSRFLLVPLTDEEGAARAACFHVEPGDRVGRHEAAARQLFCVVAGSGWVAGQDGARVPIAAGQAAAWERGEPHEAGSDGGMTAVVLEGDGFSVRAPPWSRSPLAGSYSLVHTVAMPRVRRTVSLPPHVAARLDREARRRGLSFSAVVATLAERVPEELPYAGLVEDDEDLALRVEEVLARLAR